MRVVLGRGASGQLRGGWGLGAHTGVCHGVVVSAGRPFGARWLDRRGLDDLEKKTARNSHISRLLPYGDRDRRA